MGPETAPKKHNLRVILNLSLLLVGGVLFALSFPNVISDFGWFPLAWLAMLPVFMVVNRSGILGSFFYGAFYGFVSYALFNFWLAKFHPVAIIIVPVIYLGYLAVAFPVFSLIKKAFPKYGYVFQALAWVAYEFVKTLGFVGYSYGVIGYSQVDIPWLLQLASFAGVWPVSLLVVFPAIAAAWFWGKDWQGKIRMHAPVLAGYVLLLIAGLVWGAVSAVPQARLDAARQWRVATVQQNIDPWKGGLNAYRTSLDKLIRLSDQALSEQPELVVWSETAFVPSIYWHSRFREDPERYELVKKLLDYLKESGVSVLFGNNDNQPGRNEQGETVRQDYNAALLFSGGALVDTYRKTHLVPFTEHFPYRGIFTWMYEWLKNSDTHFWEKGLEYTVFKDKGVSFSAPICFEDTFGYLTREFVLRGAQVIVNLTNDSWSNSTASMMQHANMARFRAAELHRSLIRSTNGGYTCFVNPNGAVLASLPMFEEGYLVSSVPVYDADITLYASFGDWFPVFSMLLVIIAAIANGVYKMIANRPSNMIDKSA